jgi:hypothetical protein
VTDCTDTRAGTACIAQGKLGACLIDKCGAWRPSHLLHIVGQGMGLATMVGGSSAVARA